MMCKKLKSSVGYFSLEILSPPSGRCGARGDSGYRVTKALSSGPCKNIGGKATDRKMFLSTHALARLSIIPAAVTAVMLFVLRP